MSQSVNSAITQVTTNRLFRFGLSVPLMVGLIVGLWFGLAKTEAVVMPGLVTGSTPNDLVAGATDADYDVSFVGEDPAMTNTIIVTFPTTPFPYTITDNPSLGAGAVTGGVVLVNFIAVGVLDVAGIGATREIVITLMVPIAMNTTVQFGIAMGVQNPIVSGPTDPFMVDTGAPGEVAANPVGVVITNAAATQYVITNPADGTVDAAIPVTVELQDQFGNVVTTGADKDKDVTLAADGSATGAGVVDIVNGTGTPNISDTVAETVNLSLNTPVTAGAAVTSMQDVVFANGAATQYVITNPADGTVDAAIPVTVELQDQHGNLVTTGGDEEKDVTLAADGSATGAGVVDIVTGTGFLNISDMVAQTVNLSLNTPVATATVTSMQDVVFAHGVPTQAITTVMDDNDGNDDTGPADALKSINKDFAVQVAIFDQFMNPTPDATVGLIFTPSGSTATLGGVGQPAAQATFDLSGDGEIEIPNFQFTSVNGAATITAAIDLVPGSGDDFNDASDPVDVQTTLTYTLGAPVAVAEGNPAGVTQVTFSVTPSRAPSGGDVTVTGTIAGSGANPTDATDNVVFVGGTNTRNFSDGVAQNFTVEWDKDNTVELNETFTVTLSIAAPADMGDDDVAFASSPGTGTINNDDSATISINDRSIAEGTGGATTNFDFTVTLSNPVDVPVVVNVATAPGVVNPGTVTTDFANPAGPTTTIPAGMTTRVFDGTEGVNAVHDNIVEPDETFFVNLSGIAASGREASLSFGDSQGLGTIVNDDTTLLLVNASSGSEAGSVGYTVPVPEPCAGIDRRSCIHVQHHSAGGHRLHGPRRSARDDPVRLDRRGRRSPGHRGR